MLFRSHPIVSCHRREAAGRRLLGCATYTDIGFSDMTWGGIWGHVVLESRSDAWLSDLSVQPNLADSSCSASVTLNVVERLGASGRPGEDHCPFACR